MQQINLYTQDLKPQKVVLPLEQIVAVLVVIILMQIAYTFYYSSQVAALEAEVAPKQQRVDDLEQASATMETELKAKQRDVKLVSLNIKLNRQVGARKQLLSMLDSLAVANQYPFSSLMLGLARHRIDSLFLTQFEFANSGVTVGLKGRTMQASAVPEYLQMLREEELFLGRSFDLFELSNDESNDKLLHFTLSSSLISLGADDE